MSKCDLFYQERPYSGYLYLHPNGQKNKIFAIFYSLCCYYFLNDSRRSELGWYDNRRGKGGGFILGASRRSRKMKDDAGRCGRIKLCGSCVDLGTAILTVPLVITKLIETIESLRVQGPKSNIPSSLLRESLKKKNLSCRWLPPRGCTFRK
jgi:hypothetical protein